MKDSHRLSSNIVVKIVTLKFCGFYLEILLFIKVECDATFTYFKNRGKKVIWKSLSKKTSFIA